MTNISQSIDREKIAYYRAKIAKHPDSSFDLGQAAEYFIGAGLLHEALTPLERLIALHPDDLSFRLLRGTIFGELGQYDDAKREFMAVAERDPHSTAAYHNLGLMYCATNQPDQAEQQFLQITRVEPGNFETLNDLAVLYAATDQPAKAQDAFERCLKLNVEYRKGWQNALDFALTTGRLAWGRQWLGRLKAHNVPDLEIDEWETKLAGDDTPAGIAKPAADSPATSGEQGSRATVSVVIPAFNTAQLVVETIRGLSRQTYDELEITVVDDGSTDNTEAALASFGDKVSYLRRVHQGWAAALNEGILCAAGSYILPLSPGATLPARFIENQIAFLRDHPEAQIAPDGIFGGNSSPEPGQQLPIFRRRTFARCGFFDEAAEDDTGEWSRTLMAARVAQCCDHAGHAAKRSGKPGMPADDYRRRILERYWMEMTSPIVDDLTIEAPAVHTANRTGCSLIIIGDEDPGGGFSSLAAAVNDYTPHQCRIITRKPPSAVPAEEVRELAGGADWLIFATGIAPGAARGDCRLEDTDEIPFGGVDWTEYTNRKKCAAFLCSTPSVRGNYRWYDERFQARGWPVLTSSADVCLNVPDSVFIPPVLPHRAPEYTRPDFAVGPVVIVYHDRPAYASGREDTLVPVAARMKKKYGDGVSFGRYTDLSRREALIFRHQAHIGLDRLSFGAPRFGLTSLENSALGLVNIVYLDPFVRSLLSRALGTEELPWHSPESVDALFDIVDRLTADPAELQKQMKQTAAWFRRWWAAPRIVQRFTAALEKL